MSADGDHASEQGRFAAREFVARWSRETCEPLSPVATDRMTFSYEMGYLRGRSDAMQAAMTMFDEARRASEKPGKASEESDDDTDAK